VEWLKSIPKFEFDLENYQNMLAVFKKELAASKV